MANGEVSDKGLIVFQDKKIRRSWFNDEWWFVAVDIIEVLTDSHDPSGYLKDMRRRDEGFAKGWRQIATPLLMDTPGGKQTLNCVSVKGAFRLIQSIPSPKAEPFKQWLAQVGYERVQEIHDPELAQERMKELYEQKGYSKSWIDKRLRGIVVRQDLTDEWKKRGVTTDDDFSILTAEISKASFGMTPSEYKQLKGLDKENLRDHMHDLELIFTMLGEASTAAIEKAEDPKTFDHHKIVSKDGGTIAKDARIALEKRTKRKVISKDNFIDISEKVRRKQLTKK